MLKTISLTTDFNKKIPPVRVKNHMSKISCQNFSSIWRLIKRESLFYQEDANYKTRSRSTLKSGARCPTSGTHWLLPPDDPKMVPSDTKLVAYHPHDTVTTLDGVSETTIWGKLIMCNWLIWHLSFIVFDSKWF